MLANPPAVLHHWVEFMNSILDPIKNRIRFPKAESVSRRIGIVDRVIRKERDG